MTIMETTAATLIAGNHSQAYEGLDEYYNYVDQNVTNFITTRLNGVTSPEGYVYQNEKEDDLQYLSWGILVDRLDKFIGENEEVEALNLLNDFYIYIFKGTADIKRTIAKEYMCSPRMGYYTAMLNDMNRNRMFRAAIRKKVKPGSIVIDAGSGSGILSVFSAIEGAEKVYAVEKDVILHGVSKQLIKKNGYTDRIETLCKSILHLQESDVGNVSDVLICELIGDDLFKEGIIPYVNHLKQFLKKDATIIPSGGRLVARLIETERVRDLSTIRSTIEDCDMSALAELTKDCGQKPIRISHRQLHAGPFRFLSDEFVLFELSLYDDVIDFSKKKEFRLEATQAGICDGILIYPEIILDEQNIIHTVGKSVPTHWSYQLVRNTNIPTKISAGDALIGFYHLSALNVTFTCIIDDIVRKNSTDAQKEPEVITA